MARIVNALLVRWADGFRTVVDAPSIASYGRKEGYIVLGGVQTVEEVDRICAALFVFQAVPRVATTLGVEPVDATDTPFLAFNVADYVDAPDTDDTVNSQRVVSITCAEDENGEVTFAPELKATRLISEEALDRHLKRLVDGALKGTTDSPSPTAGPNTSITPNPPQNGAVVGQLKRSVSGFDAPRSGIGTSGGTFDPDSNQVINYRYNVSTTCGASGLTVITFPNPFPTGLLYASVTPSQPITNPPVMIIDYGASDNTQITVLTRISTTNANYPNGDAIGFNVDVEGW